MTWPPAFHSDVEDAIDDVSATYQAVVQSSQMRPGRVYTTRFASSEEDAGMFDLTNYSYVTTSVGSGSKPAIKATSAATVSSILTKDRLQDVDIRMKYLLTADTTYGATRGAMPIARYCGASTYWQFTSNWGNAYDGFGAPYDNQALVRISTGNITGYSGTANGSGDTNVDTWRYARFRVWADAYAFKNWHEGSDEPAWAACGRMVATGPPPGIGLAGVRSQYSGFSIGELRITELVR